MRVPGSSANLGPGLRLHGGGGLAEAGAGGDRDGAASRWSPSCRSPRAARTCACARSSACTPADAFTFRIGSEIPLSGGLGSSAAAIVAGTMAADHLFEMDVDLLAQCSELEGHPDNVAASLRGGFVVCADGQATRFEPPTGLEALAVVPAQAVRTSAARAALAEQVPLQDAVFNVAHAALLTLGLAKRRLGPARARAAGPPAPAAALAAVPALLRACAARARARRARRDDLRRRTDGAGVVLLRADGRRRRGAARRDRRLGDAAAHAVRAAGRLRRRALVDLPG